MKSISHIRTAVFPVAGLGTRFLPITKVAPKELLPIIDKPIIQFAVEEAIKAGVTNLIFVTSSNKRALEDYFDTNYELESMLELRSKLDLLKTVKDIIPPHVTVSYVRQSPPTGLGGAISCAKHLVSDEYFAVLLPDDLIDSDNGSCLQQLVETFRSTQSSVVAVERVATDKVSSYGIIEPREDDKSIISLLEKPALCDAPSDLAIIGRYILHGSIFSFIDNAAHNPKKEIQLTDAINRMLKKQRVYYRITDGKRYDCGSKYGYLQAMTVFALKHHELSNKYLNFLKETVGSLVKEGS
ncbi:MAG: UTP--glucose-1-phosphate uridylyltransferase [Coxiellaceae bacterium]|nr:UTP--glucose-1-phosphate uridylyltransferase [Coxiellaceae bacterium]